MRMAFALVGALATIACTSTPPEPRAVRLPMSGTEFRAEGVHPSSTVGAVPIAVLGPDGADLGLPPGELRATPDRIAAAGCPPGSLIAVVSVRAEGEADWLTSTQQSAELAVGRFNAVNPDCQLGVRGYAVGPDPDQAALVAAEIAGDAGVLAIIAQTASFHIEVMGDILAEAGVPIVTASATVPEVTTHGWRNLYRAVATEAVRAAAATGFIAQRHADATVCVIWQEPLDLVAEAEAMMDALGPAVDDDCSDVVGTRDWTFPPAVAAITAAAPDIVYFVGFCREAAEFLTVLRTAGSTAEFLGIEAGIEPCFFESADESARGALFLTTYEVPTREFAERYEAAYGQQPGKWAMETYELATVMIEGIADGAVTDRSSMAGWLDRYAGHGVVRYFSWDPSGEMILPEIWVHEIT